MTGDPRPYPEYKDSGLPWIGSVPTHWDNIPLRRICHIQSGVTLGKKYEEVELEDRPYLRVANVQSGFLNLKQIKRISVSQQEAKSCELRSGDVVVTEGGDIDKLGRGAIWKGQIEGCLHQNHIFAIRPHKNRLEPRFLSLLLESRHGRVYFEITAKKTTNLASTNKTTLGLFPLFLPPPDEQKAIANYLDAHAVRVNRFIRNRRRLIEVLNEQKQAIINRAVTRGLDPNARLKPSGIDWLGEIPEHWDVVKLKRVARINPSRSEAFEHRDSGEGVVFLPMERVSVNGHVDGSEFRPIREVWQGFTYFRRGDVVVAKITPCFENGKGACLTDLETEIGFGTTEFIVLRPSESVAAEFLYQLTMLTQFRLLGVESMTGAAGQQRVSPDFVANFVIPIPPKHEQARILTFVDAKTANFRALIDRATREIDLIREYRTRLIADVVTGKVDVRGLGPAEPLPTDEEIDESIDDEELPADEEPELVEEAADE